MMQHTKATHFLEIRGQVLSTGSKGSSPWKTLTCWGAKDSQHEQRPNAVHHRNHSLAGEPRTDEQGPNAAHQRNHSHTGEPRTGIVVKLQMKITMKATHNLESQGQAL